MQSCEFSHDEKLTNPDNEVLCQLTRKQVITALEWIEHLVPKTEDDRKLASFLYSVL